LEAEQQVVTRIEALAGARDSAISGLLDAAFGPDRHGRTAYRVRRGMAWLTDLSFAALDESGALIGLLQSWPVALHGAEGEQTPLVMVGPVAVAPDLQLGGIGRALMDKLIETVDASGETRHPPLFMIGDPEYYGRFWGFVANGTDQWEVPGPVERRRLLVRGPADMQLATQGRLGPRGR
jgi:predicted N-acetyltransferase YhbS